MLSEKGSNDPKKESGNERLVELTAQLVSSYIANNTIAAPDMITMITDVHNTLQSIGRTGGGKPCLARIQKPAIPINESVTGDFIFCLEDGKKLKSLRRHLAKVYDMTPDEYREKWGLPQDYPMVAPNYSVQRSMLAKEFNLGKRNRHKQN